MSYNDRAVHDHTTGQLHWVIHEGVHQGIWEGGGGYGVGVGDERKREME